MSSKSMAAMILEQELLPRFERLGFVRPTKHTPLVRPVDENAAMWLGLSRASYGGYVVVFEPNMGISREDVQALVSQLSGRPHKRFKGATISRPLSVFMPPGQGRFTFRVDRDHRPVADELVEAFTTIGLPILESNTALSCVVGRLRDDWTGSKMSLWYRLPVALHLLGDDAGALRELDRRVKEVEGETYEAANVFRTFSERFREYVKGRT
jgi:hypothetical protein